MTDDFELLEKQLKINTERIKKLEKHKKSIEPEFKNPKSEKDHERLQETMKRLERNLQIEYEQHKRIVKAMNSESKF